jgi:hypothetical protein
MANCEICERVLDDDGVCGECIEAEPDQVNNPVHVW